MRRNKIEKIIKISWRFHMRWPNGTSYSEHKSPPVSDPQNNVTCWRQCRMNGCVRMTKVDVLQKTSSEHNRSHTIYLVSIVGLDGAAWRPALPSSYGSLNTPSDHGPARQRVPCVSQSATRLIYGSSTLKSCESTRDREWERALYVQTAQFLCGMNV